MILLMLSDQPWTHLQSWRWHLVSLTHFIVLGLGIDPLLTGVLSEHVRVWALFLPLEVNCSSTTKPRRGRPAWLWPRLSIRAVRVVCLLFDPGPPTLWPSAAHSSRDVKTSPPASACRTKPSRMFLWRVSMMVVTAWLQNEAFLLSSLSEVQSAAPDLRLRSSCRTGKELIQLIFTFRHLYVRVQVVWLDLLDH